MSREQIADEILMVARDLTADAVQEYSRKRKEVDRLMKSVHKGLDSHQKRHESSPMDWGFVGDMGRVLGLMKELDQVLR